MRKLISLATTLFLLPLATAPARADLTATTTVNGSVKIRTQLSGSVAEAIIDGLQLASNVIELISGIASGDPLGALNGALGAYREAMQLSASSGDRSAYGDATIQMDPNRVSRASIIFRVDSNDDPLGAVRAAAPVRDGIQVTTPPREDFSDNGIGLHPSASVTLDLTRLPPGRYPVLFTTKETDCHQCLSIAHLVTVEVGRRCPQQGGCPQQRAVYDAAAAAWRSARSAVHTLAANASRNYMRTETQQRACLKNHRNPADCNYIDPPQNGQCPELALGATAADCARIRAAQARVQPAYDRMMREWQRGVSMQCCLFDCTGGRADQPWVTYTPGAGAPKPGMN